MKTGMRVGLWLVVVGLLLFVGGATNGPSTVCMGTAGDDGGFELLEIDSDGVTYTPDGGVTTCSKNLPLVFVYAGLGVAAIGGLVWAGSVGRTLVGDWTT